MDLLPRPYRLEERPGTFLIRYTTAIHMNENIPGICLASAKLLKEQIKALTGHNLSIKKVQQEEAGEGNIVLSLSQKAMPEEAYTLHITEGQITIEAREERGILYGIATLIQLVRIHGNRLPGVFIEDKPSFANRGFMLDISRGRVPTVEYLKGLIDHLALYKINQLQLYVENSVKLQGWEEVWSKTDALTPEEIMELDAYCRMRGVELVPCIATFGHLYDMLRTESFRKYKEMDDETGEPFTWYHRMRYHIVNVTDEEVFPLITGILDQYLPLFSSRKVNICCDETFDLGKGKSAGEMEKKGYAALYYSYVNRLAEYLQSKGREVMIWADIVLNHPKEIEGLNKDITCLNWYYYYNEKEENVKIFADHHFKQYVCPSLSGYSRLVNAFDMSFSNIREMASFGAKYGAEGFLNTDWGDCGHINMPALSVPGMIYGAAQSWNPADDRTVEEIDEAISMMEYGDETRSFMKPARELSRQDVVIFNDVTLYRDYKIYGLSYHDFGTCLYEAAAERIKNAEEKTLKHAAAECESILDCLPQYKRKSSIGERELQEWMLSARGVMLFQTLVLLLKKYEYQQAVDVPCSTHDLAARLEEWCADYCEDFRKTSKESELFRIKEFIQDLGKLLRQYEPV